MKLILIAVLGVFVWKSFTGVDIDGGPSAMADTLAQNSEASTKWVEQDGRSLIEATSDSISETEQKAEKVVNTSKKVITKVGETTTTATKSSVGFFESIGNSILAIKDEEDAYRKAHPEKYMPETAEVKPAPITPPDR